MSAVWPDWRISRANAATSAFSEIVLPASPWAGYDAYPVEGSYLDDLHCVDWIIRGSDVAALLAVRIQWIDGSPYRTFTVRSRLASGHETELDKIMNGSSAATHWLQAYVQSYDSTLAGAAAIRGADLRCALEEGIGGSKSNGEDGTIFRWVPWDQCTLRWEVPSQ